MNIYELYLIDKLNAQERPVMYWAAESNADAETEFMKMNDQGFSKVQISEHEVLVARKWRN
jgi:hypothetical protein